jgi:hypothetical protein
MPDEPLLPGSGTDYSGFPDSGDGYLELSDDLPSTPIDYLGYIDPFPEQSFWDNFDIIEWPSWMDNDFP